MTSQKEPIITSITRKPGLGRVAARQFALALQAGMRDRGELRAAWRRRSQLVRAVGTELVGFDDFAFAIGAGGVEVAFAVGAEIEAGSYGLSTLWAIIGQRLAHQKVDEKSDKCRCRKKDDHEQCPQSGIHPAAFGVAVDVGD